MSCFKILVLFIIAQCCGHRIFLHKEIEIKHDAKPFNLLAFIHGKWIPLAEAAKASVAIQKRELVSGPEVLPKEEKPPAPTVELIEEDKKPELPPTFFGLLRPEPITPLTGVTGLNTNIQKVLELGNNPVPIPVQPEFVGELYGGLPPIQPIPAEPIPKEEVVPPPVKVPPIIEPPPAEAPPPALFDKTRVRQYAVYAGDVILKYLSQFFNRARLTFNRFTSPPPPEPVFQN